MNTNTAYKQYPAMEYGREYQGLPLNEDTPVFMKYELGCALKTIDIAMNLSPSLIWTSFALHLPENRPLFLEYYSNQVVTKFLESLNYRAVWKQKHLAGGNTVKRKAHIDFIWDKDISRNGKPFYRVMLLLNREAYNHQGAPHYTDEDTLLYRLYSTWAKALNITEAEARKLVMFSGKKISFIGNEYEDLVTVFEKASMLCKVPVQDLNLGCTGFGTSR